MLSLNNIHKSFFTGTPDENNLFNNFSLRIEKGEFLNIIGNNGAGKSSLINLLMGNIEVDKGEIKLKDKDITLMPIHKRAKIIGRVFQAPGLGTCPSMTVLENLSLAKQKSEGFFNLSFVIRRKSTDFYQQELEKLGLGLENKLNTPVRNLSGGQKQGLSLLMATLSNPEILLLDEHTAALDPKASEEIMALTDRIVKEKGITSIMISHNMAHAVTYGNRLIMLQQGKVVLDVKGKEKNSLTPQKLMNKFLYSHSRFNLPEKKAI